MIKISKYLLLLTVCLVAGCSDVIFEQYDDWHAVNESGSFKRGWIPSWLPIEATNIQQANNIDTNALVLSFEVPNDNFTFAGVTCNDTVKASKPSVSLRGFPKNAHKMAHLQICDGYFVYQSEHAFYLWK